VVIVWEEPFTEDGRRCNCHIHLPADVDAEVKGLPESEREAKLKELAEGFDLSELRATGTVETDAWSQDFAVRLVFAIRPLFYYPAGVTSYGKPHAEQDRAFYPVQVGLDFTKGDPSVWPDADREELWTTLFDCIDKLAAPYLKDTAAEDRKPVPEPDRAVPVKAERFPVPQGFSRPLFNLSAKTQDLPLLQQFHEVHTPLNWAVGLTLFARTSEKTPEDWQRATVEDIIKDIWNLTERDALQVGQYRQDFMVELVKLMTARVHYVTWEWIRKGRAWRRKAVVEIAVPLPNVRLYFLDKKTGDKVTPDYPAFRDDWTPLQIEGRRAMKPDGSGIRWLPSGRWKLVEIGWRWNQSFIEDLKAAPAVDGKGKLKRNTKGKVLRTGWNTRPPRKILAALEILRREGSTYAARLLVSLAYDINKPKGKPRNVIEKEAQRLFDMLGIPEDYVKTTHRRPENLVATAIYRLKQPDIGALRPGSDERPRPPSDAERKSGRRKSDYYRLYRSDDYTPPAALVTKEEAAVIEAEEVAEAEPQPAAASKTAQAVLPGMEEPPALPIPSGADIRAAREAAGLNLRDFARMMDGREAVLNGKTEAKPAFKTWANYETGNAIRVPSIAPEVWQRVRDFIAQHGPKTAEKREPVT
jgi:hypothetical protein